MKKLTAIQTYIKNGESPRLTGKPASRSISTGQAIEEFMLSRGGLRPKTLKDYRMHLRHFQIFFPEDLPKTPQPLQSYLNSFPLKSVANPQGVEPETVHARFRTIRALYNQIQLWYPKIPNPVPLVRPPKLQKKVMRTFADDELYSLFSLPLSPRDRALVSELIDTGGRGSEYANQVWDDITYKSVVLGDGTVFPSGFVVLRGKTGEREVPVSDSTYRHLQAIRNGANGREHVFIGKRGPLTYHGIYRLVRRLCRQAGITGSRCSPHTFRHSFATSYAANPACDPKVLQDIMGHKDFKTTLRYIKNNLGRMALNHIRCTPLKRVDAAAQLSFDKVEAVKEVEKILAENTREPPRQ